MDDEFHDLDDVPTHVLNQALRSSYGKDDWGQWLWIWNWGLSSRQCDNPVMISRVSTSRYPRTDRVFSGEDLNKELLRRQLKEE